MGCVAFAALIMGIISLVRGKLPVSKQKELRGGPLYVAAALLIIPLPLQFLVGVLLGISAASKGRTVGNFDSDVLILSAITTLVPIIAAIVLGFVKGQPPLPKYNPYAPPQAMGFPVGMPPGQQPYPGQPYPPQTGYPTQPYPPQSPQQYPPPQQQQPPQYPPQA